MTDINKVDTSPEKDDNGENIPEDNHSQHTFKSDDSTVDLDTHSFPSKVTLFQLVDSLLKSPSILIKQIQAERTQYVFRNALILLILSHFIYGIIIGTFSGNTQWIAAPIKVTTGMLLSLFLCYPSLYIFACLSGTKITPTQALTLITTGISLTGILLMGFVPVAFIFTNSIQSLTFMGLIHLFVWAISIYFGLKHILYGLSILGMNKIGLIQLWAIIFIITTLQMTTTLRPILGESDTIITTEKRFFLIHWGEEIKNDQKRSD